MAQREKIIVEGEDRASDAFDKAGGSFEGMSSKIGKFAKGAIAGAAAAQLAQLGARAVSLAVDAGEAASAFETTFGPATASASAFVDEFANKAGLAEFELQQMLATAGNVAQGIGATENQSASLAQQMAVLAGDVASFSNAAGGSEAVLMALQSALTGEREALKTYGIAVSEAEVQERALQMTQKARASDLTRLEKAQATMALATEKAGKAVGDLDRTQESAANQMRRVQAEMKEAGVAVGQSLLPAVEEFLPVVRDIIPLVGEFGAGLGGLISGIAPLASAITKLMNPGLEAMAGYLDLVGDGLTSLAALAGDEGAKATLRMDEAVESLNARMAEGEDPAVALANSLAHVARNGTLTEDQFKDLARQSGLSEDRIRDVQLTLLDYARSGKETTVTTEELNDAFGETVITGGDYVDAAERMARQTRDVADAAEKEASPAMKALRERLAEVALEAHEAGLALRQDLIDDMNEFATGLEGAVDEIDITLDEFFANFEERQQQQSEFWANIALLYAHGLDALADELAAGGVENAGIVADAVDDMERAADLDQMIRDGETDARRWANAIADGVESNDNVLQRLQDFGFNAAALIARGFTAFDLASTFDTLIDEAIGTSAARAGQTGGNRTSTGGTLTTPGGQVAFADGGVVGGPQGAPVVATVHGGEEVISVRDRTQIIDLLRRIQTGSGGGEIRVIVESDAPVRDVRIESQASNLRATVERLVRQ